MIAMRRLTLGALVLLLAPVLMATGHGDAGSGTQASRVSLTVAALRGPTGVGVAPYLADGSVAGEAATVSFEIVPDPGTMVARLASGEAAVGMLPSNVVAQLYNRDVPVRIAAVTLWGLMYVVGTDESIRQWTDLEGRTVQAVGQGATPDILARHLLARNGLDPDADVTLSFRYPPVELAQLVIAGTVDLAILPEPFVTQILSRRDDARVLLNFQTEWARFYGERYPQTAIVVRADAAQEHPEAVREALALIEAGWRQVHADPEAAGAMVADSNLGLPGPVVTAALDRFNADYVPVAAARDALNRFFSVLADFDPRAVGGAVPDNGIYLSLPEGGSR